MPKNSASKIIYPQGCKEINENLPTDDLVRRMKDIAMVFQQMSQEDDNSCYIPLALYLATDFFLEHPSRDVRLLVACAIADVFRVYAPNSPYQHPNLIKTIFVFFIQQLKGLQDPKDPTFKRYFYLLENLAWVKSFNICIELDDSQFIFCQLFSLIFKIVNDNHSEKVKNFMLDMLSPLILEADSVSMKLIEITLWQIIEPKKSQNKQACWLATQILIKTSKTMEPYLIAYFNNAITHGIQSNAGELSDDEDTPHQTINPVKTRNSKNAPNANSSITQLCELVYELNQICPSVMGGILPQLDFKIRSNEEKERCEFTKLLARLFSDKSSCLAEQYPELWKSFLGRFRDISVIVRTRCVQYSMHFLVNHPKLRDDITEQLKQRQHDPDENVRYEVVMAIISAAKKGIENINEDLLSFVKERALDKKFKIRREALFGMAFLYKQCNISTPTDSESFNEPESNSPIKMLNWIKNKCMHNYYQTQLEDRLLVERILHMFLIPYSLPLNQRMKILYCFYATIDSHSARAFNELLKQQLNVRKQVKDVLDILKEDKSEERDKRLRQKIQICSKNLPEAVKAEEYITKLCKNLELNPALRQHMEIIVTSTSYPLLSDEGTVLSPPSCSTIEISVKEVLKSLGFPVQTNSFYVVVKQLMERIAPVMIDYQGLILLFDYVHDSLLNNGEYDTQFGLQNSAKRGLQLILALSTVFPAIFYGKEIFTYYLLPFLWQSELPEISEIVLQILTNIGASMNYEGCNQEVVNSIPWWAGDDVIPKITEQFILKASTTKQAKYAVQCLNAIVNEEGEKNKLFGQILDSIKADGFSLDSQYFRIHLVTTGMIAISGGYIFFPKLLRSIIHKFVVQNLLLKDQRLIEEINAQEESEKQRENLTDLQATYEYCSEEVKCKIEGIKLVVRWLHGLKLSTLVAQTENQAEEISKYQKSTENALNLLKTIIQNQGDLNDQGLGGTTLERAHLRLAAGIAMLKIVNNDAITSVNNYANPDGSNAPIAQSPTSAIMSPQQWHTLTTLMLDKEDFVKERFAVKLHKGLVSLSLGLEFLAMLSLAGTYEANSPLRNKLRSFLIVNLIKRRDLTKTKNFTNLKSILPECVMPFVIHLLAHMPFYTEYNDINQLQIVKDCLWFIMEPLVLKNEHFSFSFYKKTFENIKTCIDKVSANQVQEAEVNGNANHLSMTNYKIYCACDLALGLVMSKTQNFLLKDFPVQPSLPGKYYMVSPLAKDNNYKNYLPPQMQFAPPKRCGLETEILGKITKSFSNNVGTQNSTVSHRGRPAKNNNQSVNQIVLLSADNIVDDSNVIETETSQLVQMETSNEMSTEIVHMKDTKTVENNSLTYAPTIVSLTPTITTETSTTTSANKNPVASTPTRSRKQDLANVLNDEEEPSVKRVRLSSESSTSGTISNKPTRTSTRTNSSETKSPTLIREDNDNLDKTSKEDSDEINTTQEVVVARRRGRPPKSIAPIITKQEVEEQEIVSNTRKSSRISKPKIQSPPPSPPLKEKTSTRGRPRTIKR